MSDHAIHSIAGVRIGIACAGIKYANRRDLTLIEIAPGSHTAAVFTRNAFCAAPVRVSKANLSHVQPRYLVINTGNANAGTGQLGMDDAEATCMAVAQLMGCDWREVLPFSTGVIGEPLPLGKLVAGLPAAFADLRADGWSDAAYGIMTTDTKPKLVSRQAQIGGETVTVTGIAKGAGMIKPNMATMLSFIATDAHLPQALLQHCMQEVVDDSFNSITIDGDTSTNDSCVLIATGQGKLAILSHADTRYEQFRQLVREVSIELAQAVVRDGEGATKFITITVDGGRSRDECRDVAYTIAHSPLVKTAFFASDPNWGRILAAVGRAGLEQLDLDRIVIHLDEVCIVREGGRAADYSEDRGQMVMKRPDITIHIQLGRGAAQATIWTTDLSFDYVRINAEYRS